MAPIEPPSESGAAAAPKLSEIDSPPAESVLDGVPSKEEIIEDAQSAQEIVEQQPQVDELLGRER
jgi:hypothetical protein